MRDKELAFTPAWWIPIVVLVFMIYHIIVGHLLSYFVEIKHRLVENMVVLSIDILTLILLIFVYFYTLKDHSAPSHTNASLYVPRETV
jgi:hypothetical protein